MKEGQRRLIYQWASRRGDRTRDRRRNRKIVTQMVKRISEKKRKRKNGKKKERRFARHRDITIRLVTNPDLNGQLPVAALP